MTVFWKFRNFERELRSQFWFFEKNFGGITFFLLCVLSIAINFVWIETLWKCFTTSFWKNKKTDFFEKTCGFYTYFENYFWHQRGALKKDIPTSRDNLYDFYAYKIFFLSLKNIFLKFWNNCTHVAHFFMGH